MKKILLPLLFFCLLSQAQTALTVSVPKLSATFTDAQLTSLKNLAGQELLPQPYGKSLFSLGYIADGTMGGKIDWLFATQAQKRTASQDNGAIVLTYSDFPQLPQLAVQCRISAQDDKLAWDITVDLPENVLLTDISYPDIFIKVNDPARDNATFGANKARVIYPARVKVDSMVTARQPGSMSAQFACQNSGAYGFYLSAQDPNCSPKMVELRFPQDAMRWVWRSHLCQKGGKVVRPFPVVMTSYQAPDGQKAIWQDAADIYKQWVLKQGWCQTKHIDRKDLPQWLKEGPGMVRFGRGWLEDTTTITDWMDKVWKKHFPDIPLIAAFWGWEKVAYWVTPDYFPVYPDNASFSKMANYLRQNGAHPFPWPSGYHWTLTYQKKDDGTFFWDDRDRFYNNYKSHAIQNRDGNMYIRKPGWLNGGECTAMCPGDPWTINWWSYDICKPLVELGCDMIQVDQVVGGNFPPCYDLRHPHPQGQGVWMVEAFHKQLESMYKAMKEATDWPVLCVEEPNESFNHYVGLTDYRNCEAAYEWASVYNYIYHEYVPCFQSNPRNCNRIWEAHCAADGQIPHFIPKKVKANNIVCDNGGFEKINRHDFPEGWDKVNGFKGEVWNGKAKIETQDVHSGKQSLRLYNAPDETVQVSRNCQIDRVAIKNGAKYRISGWLKTNKMVQNNVVNCAPLDGSLKGAGTGGHLAFPKAGEGWVYREAIIEPTASADFIRIMIHIAKEAEVLVDDIRLEMSQPDGSWADAKEPGDEAYYQFAINWVKTYHANRKWLQHGMMLRPPKLDCASIAFSGTTAPAVFHNAFQAADGSRAVVLANATHEQQEVTLHWNNTRLTFTLQPAEIKIVQ